MNFLKLLRNEKVSIFLKYSSIKYIALIIGFIKGIVNASVLGPELFGVLGNLLLILSYLGYSNLGILYSMNKEYAIGELNKNNDYAKEIIKTAFTSLCLLSIVLLSAGLALKFIYHGNLSNYMVLIFCIAVLEQFRSFYINYFRLVNNFKMINLIEIINNLLSFVLIIIMIKFLMIYSVLIATLVADLVVFILGFLHSEKIKLEIDKTALKSLVLVGVPLLIYNLGYYLLTTVDRLIIIKYLDYTDLGYFTFASQIVSATLVFITSVLFLNYPKALKELNIGNGNVTEVLNKTASYTKYVELFGVVLCLVGAIAIQPFVDIIVPQYESSITIYRILIFGTIANQITYFANVFIVSNNRQVYLIILQIVGIILELVINICFIKIGLGVMGVALASLITNIIYTLVQYAMHLKILKLKKGYLKRLLNVYLKFLIFTALCVVLSLLRLDFGLYSILIMSLTVVLYLKDIKCVVKLNLFQENGN